MYNSKSSPLLVVTPGDPSGIGPEIVWKSIRHQLFHTKKNQILCIGARKPFERLKATIIETNWESLQKNPIPPRRSTPFIWLLPAPIKTPEKKIHLEGYQVGWSIEKATRLIQSGIAKALVTGPISKERLQRGGYLYSGHTDFLADLCNAGDVTMMLANKTLRITLVTTHIALKDVPSQLTREKIRRAVLHTADHLRSWWGISKPRIAVAALNPHAGEAGLFGREEIEIITPEIRSLRQAARGKYQLFGPLPSDTLFAHHITATANKRYDAVVCMYHDQGLIPVKLIDFPNTVNITLGLPIIRTSVDHGVAFDIAWKNKADPSSFRSAVDLANQLVRSSQIVRGKKNEP